MPTGGAPGRALLSPGAPAAGQSPRSAHKTRWSKGEHGAAVLHEAASAAAALVLQVPRAFDADDRLDAHAIALSAADAAAVTGCDLARSGLPPET